MALVSVEYASSPLCLGHHDQHDDIVEIVASEERDKFLLPAKLAHGEGMARRVKSSVADWDWKVFHNSGIYTRPLGHLAVHSY